jgi:hypothetical protein
MAEKKLAQQSSAEPVSPIYIAINMSKVANNEDSFHLMHKVGPRVCITTASHPGFLAVARSTWKRS